MGRRHRWLELPRRLDLVVMSTTEFEQFASSQKSRLPVGLLLGFWVSVGIALAAVGRRFIALLRPSNGGPAQMAALNATFSSHTFLTLAHIIPAAFFVGLAAVVLLRRSSGKWLEQLFFLFGAITGITAYAMSAYAIGGWVERSAVFVFDSWFLFSLACAYWYREAATRRVWMTRAVGILLGIATTRPVMGFFFATSAATHLEPKQFFGFAFWIGFSINAIIIEAWLHSKRRAQMYELWSTIRQSEATRSSQTKPTL